MTVNKAHGFRILFELVIRSVDTYSVNPSQVNLHWRIVIFAFDPTVKEASMDLLDLYYEHIIDVFVHDQLSQRVFILSMRIA